MRWGAALAAAGLLAAAAWSARGLWAEGLMRSATVEAARRASRLEPWDARPPASAGDFAGALARNGRDAASWINLALEHEMRGDVAAAEACLERAARLNRQWDPRWALANFHLRRDAPDRFWYWAGQAAGMSYPPRTALFHLAGRMAGSAEEVTERLIRPHPELAPEYLRFSLDTGNRRPAAQLAVMLIDGGERGHLPLVLEACDALLGPDLAGGAARIWSRLAEAGWIDRDPALLYNGGFSSRITGRGFDWRVAETDGVLAEARPGELVLRFTGRQPERAMVLTHYAALEPGGRYRLRSRPDLPPGLEWRVSGDPKTSIPLAGSRRDEFTATRLVRIELWCERRPGTTRIQGTVTIANAGLERLDR